MQKREIACYTDILESPRPQAGRDRMPANDRAAQFAAFEALPDCTALLDEETFPEGERWLKWEYAPAAPKAPETN